MSAKLIIVSVYIISISVGHVLIAEDITNNIGSVYSNVTIVRAEPDALVVMGSKGISRMPFTELSPDMQKRFNYDPALASKYQSQQEERKLLKKTSDIQSANNAKKKQYLSNIYEALEREKRDVTGKVLQTTQDGILLSNASFSTVITNKTTRIDSSDTVQRITPRVVKKTDLYYRRIPMTSENEPICIYAAESGLHDGASWSGTIYPAGTYKYVSVIGAEKTIKRYALSAEMAFRLENGELFQQGNSMASE